MGDGPSAVRSPTGRFGFMSVRSTVPVFRCPRGWRVVASILVGLLAFAGCSVQGSLPGESPKIRTVGLAHPVYEPTWSGKHGALFALVQGRPRVARIVPVAGGDP